VVAAAALALAATHVGSCAARMGHAQAVTPATRPTEIVAPASPAVKPMLPLAVPAPSPSTSPSPSLPAPATELVPAGALPAEAMLRVQVEGQATFVVDGRTQRAFADGELHLAPGHHRVTVSSPMLAFPRTLEVDLRPREAATRAITRGRGTLRVAVTPWAEVTVDGRALGTTPLSPVDLAEGAHQVALKNGELGIIAKRRVMVAPDKETLLKLDLFSERR
jgi:hypothetical protein